MRVISGFAKGRKLKVPSSKLIRPATDKVREAIFNILGSVEGYFVGDFFAGSGSIGIEALSRGANQVLFVDSFPLALKTIRENIALCQFESQSQVIKSKLPIGLSKFPPFHFTLDLCFVDPPYDQNLVNPCLDQFHNHKLIDDNSLLIIEHSPREKITCDAFTITDHRQYGQTHISFLKRK